MATAVEEQTETIEPVEPQGLYEVVDGAVREKPPMGAYEAELANLIALSMGPFAQSNGLGRVLTEMLFLIDREANLRRRPDVSFVSAERWPVERRAPRTAAWEVVPDLAVEVVSPGDLAGDLRRKVEEFFRAGVRAVWVVYPELAKVDVYQGPKAVAILGRGDILDGGGLLPGFRLSLDELFGDAA